MRELWYVLEDGTLGDPRDVAPDDVGNLKHKKSGKRIAMDGDVPATREVNLQERAKDMRAQEAARPYRTREIKAK
jgi:hypothetical protein